MQINAKSSILCAVAEVVDLAVLGANRMNTSFVDHRATRSWAETRASAEHPVSGTNNHGLRKSTHDQY